MSDFGGYAGKFLRVDLTHEQTIDVTFDEDALKKYIGGTGIGAKLLYEEVPPEADWSNPENRLILASGPLGGTRIGGSGTISLVTKGALTNGGTSVQANGHFGAYLKFCGYDGVIMHGAARRWLYLYITDGRAEWPFSANTPANRTKCSPAGPIETTLTCLSFFPRSLVSKSTVS